MNNAEARHSKSIARHVRAHLENMLHSMTAIENSGPSTLADVPVDMMVTRFGELEYHWDKIQQVFTDMLPELKQ